MANLFSLCVAVFFSIKFAHFFIPLYSYAADIKFEHIFAGNTNRIYFCAKSLITEIGYLKSVSVILIQNIDITCGDIRNILPVHDAIDEALRGRGYGSQALKLLYEFYAGKRIMVEAELPDGTSENEKQRMARKRFYLRTGYSETPVKYLWRHGKYEILSFGGSVSEQDYNDFWKSFNI